MSPQRQRTARGFTLIELLVVVAIIALLISILLPSLSRAREQARLTKCIANLKGMGTAMHMYFGEHREWFPFEKQSFFGTAPGLHGFYYGGHPGRKNPFDSTGRDWWGFLDPTYRDTFAGRPFNRYMGFQNLRDTREDVREQENNAPEFNERRSELEKVFACPSDVGGRWNTDPFNVDNEDDVPIYWKCGSSYDLNYQMLWEWNGPRNSSRNRDRETKKKWLWAGNKLLAKQREFHAGRFVVLYEDTFDNAQWWFWSRRGWHRQANKHSFLFLDGHAAYTTADPSNGQNNGPGWKTLGGGKEQSTYKLWWENEDDPDFQYRDLKP